MIFIDDTFRVVIPSSTLQNIAQTKFKSEIIYDVDHRQQDVVCHSEG